MSIITAIMVCAFVYVIRVSLDQQGEEEWSGY